MLWGAASITENVAVEGFYQYEWQQVRIPPVGWFFSSGDLIGVIERYFERLRGVLEQFRVVEYVAIPRFVECRSSWSLVVRQFEFEGRSWRRHSSEKGAERSLDEAQRNPGRSAGRGAGIPDSTSFHPGYGIFLGGGPVSSLQSQASFHTVL